MLENFVRSVASASALRENSFSASVTTPKSIRPSYVGHSLVACTDRTFAIARYFGLSNRQELGVTNRRCFLGNFCAVSLRMRLNDCPAYRAANNGSLDGHAIGYHGHRHLITEVKHANHQTEQFSTRYCGVVDVLVDSGKITG